MSDHWPAPGVAARPDGAVIFGDGQQGTVRVAQVVVVARSVSLRSMVIGADPIAPPTLAARLRRYRTLKDNWLSIIEMKRLRLFDVGVGAIDGQGERTVMDTGRSKVTNVAVWIESMPDLSLIIDGDREFWSFQDQSMGDVSALIAGERRLVRSQLLDGARRAWFRLMVSH